MPKLYPLGLGTTSRGCNNSLVEALGGYNYFNIKGGPSIGLGSIRVIVIFN